MLSAFDIRINQERLSVFDDQDAYKKLFYHFYERLKRFAKGIVRDDATAEDIVAECFLILWNSRAKLTEVENLNSYLYIITKNIAIKELGKARKINSFSIADIELDFCSVTEKTPEDYLLNNELLRHLDNAVEALPPKCKLIYKLVKKEGLRYKEIASILNISVKTIDAQMAIASRRITQSIQFAFTDYSSN